MGAGIAAGPHSSVAWCPTEAWHVSFGEGSGRGLSAPVGSLSGSSSGAGAPFERSQGCPAKRTSPGPLRVASGASSLGFPGRPVSEANFRNCLSLPDLPRGASSPCSIRPAREKRSELRDLKPFAVSPRPEGFEVRWTGSGKWGRLRLSPSPRASSRPRPAFFGLARHPRRSAALPPLSAAASEPLSRFRGGFSSAALEQCAPDSIRAIGPGLWITGISGMELIQFNASPPRPCSFAAPLRRAARRRVAGGAPFEAHEKARGMLSRGLFLLSAFPGA
jgi:hypothetical protein